MERQPLYPKEGRKFILLQHISETRKDFSIGDPRRQGEAVGSALKGIYYSVTGKYPHDEGRRIIVVEAGSGQGRLHKTIMEFLGNARVVGIEQHPGAVEVGKSLGRKIIRGDYTKEGPWEEIREKYGDIDLSYMVYTSLQGDPRKENPKELMKRALIQMLKNSKVGILFEVVHLGAGLERLLEREASGEINHGGGKVERYTMRVTPVDEKFGWWSFEQELYNENGDRVAVQRVYLPIILKEGAFEELLREVSKELGKRVRIIDKRDRDSHKPPGKEYATWYLLTTKEIKVPYREGRILERKLASS